jgi:hypothetical protein
MPPANLDTLEAIMPKKRPAPVTDERLPAAVGVAALAALCQLSRSRFHALVRAGVFPPPQQPPGRRPHYPTELIRRCLDIRHTGVGANGQVVMFNRRTPAKPKR